MLGDGGSSFIELICSGLKSIDRLVSAPIDSKNPITSSLSIQTSFVPSLTFPLLQGTLVGSLSWMGMGPIFQSFLTGEYQKQIPKHNRAIVGGIFFLTTTLISMSKKERSHITSNIPLLRDLDSIFIQRRDEIVVERILKGWHFLDELADETKFIYNDVLKKWKRRK